MARDPRHDVLFEPIRIGPKTLRNRFYQVPHCTGFGVVKPWSQARHRAVKAEGGWAAVCTEFCSISPEATETPCRLWDDDDVRALSIMCDEVARPWRSGRRRAAPRWRRLAQPRVAPCPSLAPSQIAGDHQLATPKAMQASRHQARAARVGQQAATRAERAGFDIVYVYGAHSYLPMQFLSPFYNQRSDGYGGSFEHRARFWLETLEQVRAAVGERCAIACRIAVDALGPAGSPARGGPRVHRPCRPPRRPLGRERGLDRGVVQGQRVFALFPRGLSARVDGEGPFRSRRSRSWASARLTSPDKMAEIVRSGTFDLIGSARPVDRGSLPPEKISEGRLDDIRECTGYNHCTGRGGMYAPGVHAEPDRRRGVPEGLASRALREGVQRRAGRARHRSGTGRDGVRDRARQAGDATGPPRRRQSRSWAAAMRWIPRLPGLGEWARVVNYRKIQIDKLCERRVRPAHPARRRAARRYGAEIVVVATGAHWAGDGLGPGSRGPVPGRGRRHSVLPHARAGRPRRQAAPGPPGRRLRLRGLLHGSRAGRAPRPRRLPRRAS